MKSMGVHVGKDLKAFSEHELIRRFGKSGKFFYHMVRGEDKRPVKPNRITKSIGIEDTFAHDLKDPQDMIEELKGLCERLEKRLTAKSKQGRTVTLKVKFADFSIITRSKTSSYYINAAEDVLPMVLDLFSQLDMQDKRVRLLGVTVSNFYENDLQKLNSPQLRLF